MTAHKPSSARAVLDRGMSEDELLTAVVEAALFLGYQVHHDRRSDLARQMGTPGFFDLILARDGVLFFVELKSAVGSVNPGQHAWRKALPLDSYTNRFRIWRPADLDAALQELTRP